MSVKRIHLLESQLNEIRFSNSFQAGTDNPYYVDEKTNSTYEASWNGEYAYPFGYWPTTYGSTACEFSLGEAYDTHVTACGKCAQLYYNDAIQENIGEASREIEEALNTLYNEIREYGYRYNEEEGTYVSADGSESMDIDGFVDRVRDELYDYSYDLSYKCNLDSIVQDMLNGEEYPNSDDIEKMLYNEMSEFDFTDKEGINQAMEELGMDFDSYFEMGRNEGRIWPEKEMIGFYESEQPDPHTLVEILRDLSSCSEIGLDVSDMLQFTMVFEDWRNDGTITACTLQDYIDGNYGYDEDEEEDVEEYPDEDEEEEPIQYNNGQKTVFVPHLANQDQKREFFKDFRNTRDQSVYVPRERGAGNLARYHAMRYPYGENKIMNKKTIK